MSGWYLEEIVDRRSFYWRTGRYQSLLLEGPVCDHCGAEVPVLYRVSNARTGEAHCLAVDHCADAIRWSPGPRALERAQRVLDKERDRERRAQLQTLAEELVEQALHSDLQSRAQLDAWLDQQLPSSDFGRDVRRRVLTRLRPRGGPGALMTWLLTLLA